MHGTKNKLPEVITIFLLLLFHKLVEPNSHVALAMEPSAPAGCSENTVKMKEG
jgi:hypothetical protein